MNFYGREDRTEGLFQAEGYGLSLLLNISVPLSNH